MHASDFVELLSRQQGLVAHIVVIDIKGSAPRHPGARMLALPDGKTIGTIGGGAVEALVTQEAISCLAARESRLFKVDMLGDTALDAAPICGGGVTVAIFPVEYMEPYTAAADLLRQGRRAVLVSPLPKTAVAGAASGLPGSVRPRLYGIDEGEAGMEISLVAGGPGDGPAEPDLEALRAAAATGLPVASARDGLLYDPFLPQDRLLILGGGHVGQALAQLAVRLDFLVCVADERPEFLEPGRFPAGVETRLGLYAQLIAGYPSGPSVYAVVVSPGHSTDLECVRALLRRTYRYAGFIGSRRKVAMILDQARSEGFPAERVDALHAPIGLDIGAETPSEISVSILAELIATRRNAPALTAR